MTARCTTVSTFSWRMSFPIATWRVSAWTKSISSSALIGSFRSHPNRWGTWGASRRATSAPRGLETPVTRTRLGPAGVTPRLWIDTAHRCCVGHPLHRQRVSGQAHVDAFVDRRVEDLVEGPRDDVMQLGVDLLLLPEEGLEVLDPLEVRDDHATRVGDNVGHDEDVPVVEDRVRLRRDRRIGSFRDQPSANSTRIVAGDLVLHGRRHEHGDGQLDDLVVRDVVGLLETGHSATNRPVLFQGREIEPAGVVHTSAGIADGDDLQPGLREEAGRRPSDLAVTLHGDCRSLLVDV